MRDACGAAVEAIELPIDDSWMRDSGPIVVTGAEGHRAGVDFRFNGWGKKFTPYDRDDAMNQALLPRLGLERLAADLVLEGGSISVDGEGIEHLEGLGLVGRPAEHVAAQAESEHLEV